MDATLTIHLTRDSIDRARKPGIMKTFIIRIAHIVDDYLSTSRSAAWEAYLSRSSDPVDLERRLRQLERGEVHHFGLD